MIKRNSTTQDTVSDDEQYDNNPSVYELLSEDDYPKNVNRSHPYHMSHGKKNFKVDPDGKTFRCWRHEVTGNVFHLLGIKEEIIDCGEWDEDGLSDEQWAEIASEAEEQGIPVPRNEYGSCGEGEGTDNPLKLTAEDEDRLADIDQKVKNDQIDAKLFGAEYVQALARLKSQKKREYLRLKQEIKQAAPHKFNTTDLFDHVEEKMEELANRWKQRKRSSLLSDTGIEVLGEDESGAIHLFNPETKKVRVVPKIDDLEYNDAVQLAGPEFEHSVAKFSNTGDDNLRIHYERFKREVVKQSRKNPLVNLKRKGQGIHRFEENRAMVVSGPEAEIIDPDQIDGQPLESPVYEDYFIGFTPGGSWIDLEELKAYMEELSDPSERKEVVEDLFDIVKQWNFQNGHVDQFLVIGGILQTIAQDYPESRPHYAFIGRKECGKSTLFEDVMDPLLPGLTALFTSGSTEAGMRQKLVNPQNGAVDLKFAIRDEFEKVDDYSRDKIMAWFRAATKGKAPVVKGTGDQTGAIEYPIQNSFWIGSTEFGGGSTAADWSRFVRLHLDMPEGDLSLPGSSELEELGKKLTAMSVLVAEGASSRISEMAKNCSAEVGRRMKKHHAAPLAFLKECLPEQEIDNIDVPDLTELLRTRSSETEIPEDRDEVLQKILQYNIQVEIEEDFGQENTTIGAALEQVIRDKLNGDTAETQFERQLESRGIRVINSPKFDGWIVFFHSRKVKECLQRTKFEGKSVKNYLTNFEEAKKVRERIKGFSSTVRGVCFPVDMFRNNE